jgi:hypothetical protein
VHLRRALLLFAIVLGLAAVAAALSRPGDDRGETPPPSVPRQPTASPGTSGEPPPTILFDADRDQTRRLEADRPATVEIAVDEPGQVEIPLLGLSAPAEPVTPARFDVLVPEARRYPITFTPAAGDEPRPAGILAVTAAQE